MEKGKDFEVVVTKDEATGVETSAIVFKDGAAKASEKKKTKTGKGSKEE